MDLYDLPTCIVFYLSFAKSLGQLLHKKVNIRLAFNVIDNTKPYVEIEVWKRNETLQSNKQKT